MMRVIIVFLLSFAMMTNVAVAQLDGQSYMKQRTALNAEWEKLVDKTNEVWFQVDQLEKMIPKKVKAKFDKIPVRSNELRACLRDRGVNVPTGTKGKTFLSAADQQKYEADGIRDCRVFARYMKQANELAKLDDTLTRQTDNREYAAAIQTVKQIIASNQKLYALAQDVYKSRKQFYNVILAIQKNDPQ